MKGFFFSPHCCHFTLQQRKLLQTLFAGFFCCYSQRFKDETNKEDFVFQALPDFPNEESSSILKSDGHEANSWIVLRAVIPAALVHFDGQRRAWSEWDFNIWLRTVLESETLQTRAPARLILELFLYQKHRKFCLILQCESRNSSLFFHVHYKRLHVLHSCKCVINQSGICCNFY